jgi:hypothetical protein
MKKYLIILLFSIMAIEHCIGQKDTMYTYHSAFELANHLKILELFDPGTKTKFILDSVQIHISAVDSNGNKIWTTDPHRDGALERYRFDRPIIVEFYFANSKRTGNKEVIWIIYNNTQFGFVDKKTGKFTWLGQD